VTAPTSFVRLSVGSIYRVNGVLHDYLGPAISPDTGGLIHAFGRREWLPDIPDQLLVTLITETSLNRSVTHRSRPDWSLPRRAKLDPRRAR
jgi:hypothetical protein